MCGGLEDLERNAEKLEEGLTPARRRRPGPSGDARPSASRGSTACLGSPAPG